MKQLIKNHLKFSGKCVEGIKDRLVGSAVRRKDWQEAHNPGRLPQEMACATYVLHLVALQRDCICVLIVAIWRLGAWEEGLAGRGGCSSEDDMPAFSMASKATS